MARVRGRRVQKAVQRKATVQRKAAVQRKAIPKAPDPKKCINCKESLDYRSPSVHARTACKNPMAEITVTPWGQEEPVTITFFRLADIHMFECRGGYNPKTQSFCGKHYKRAAGLYGHLSNMKCDLSWKVCISTPHVPTDAQRV